MNLAFRVIEITDREELADDGRTLLMRAVTYRVLHNGDPVEECQWRWGGVSTSDLPYVQVGDQFELTPMQGRGESLRGDPVYLEVGQLWWLSSQLELVQVLEGVDRHDNFTEVMVMSQVPDAAARMGDKAMIVTCRLTGTDGRVFGPEYGPIYIASGDRKVAS